MRDIVRFSRAVAGNRWARASVVVFGILGTQVGCTATSPMEALNAKAPSADPKEGIYARRLFSADGVRMPCDIVHLSQTDACVRPEDAQVLFHADGPGKAEVQIGGMVSGVVGSIGGAVTEGLLLRNSGSAGGAAAGAAAGAGAAGLVVDVSGGSSAVIGGVGGTATAVRTGKTGGAVNVKSGQATIAP